MLGLYVNIAVYLLLLGGVLVGLFFGIRLLARVIHRDWIKDEARILADIASTKTTE